MTLPEKHEPLEDYKYYKKNYFENTKTKIRRLMENIKHTSLKKEDKTKLINEISLVIEEEFKFDLLQSSLQLNEGNKTDLEQWILENSSPYGYGRYLYKSNIVYKSYLIRVYEEKYNL